MARKSRQTGRRDRSGPRPRRQRAAPGILPSTCVLTVSKIDEFGEALAVPVTWDTQRTPPHITLAEAAGPEPGVGDRVLARIQRGGRNRYTAHVIRILPIAQPKPLLGIYRTTAQGGLIEPTDRRDRDTYMAAREDSLEAEPGELVLAEALPGQGRMLRARITQRLGLPSSARAASVIAIHANALPTRFSDAALREAAHAPAPVPEGARADLRDLALATIDGEDAKDFDDAVFAEPDPRHPGGWHMVVAIADVSYYVSPGSALDEDAFLRGNSTYFPDRVVPMLPERLSNGLCSLNPGEDRYCLAAHLWIDAQGVMHRAAFERALMRSAARLTYTQVQAIADSGKEHPQVTPLLAAYAALKREREKRAPLEISLPEYQVALDAAGNVRAIAPRARHESHRLIEAFMIAANVAAAGFLLKQKAHGIFRVHEPPDLLRVAELRTLLAHMGYHLPKGDGIAPRHFNRVLEKSTGAPEETIVHQSILRTQTQAYYASKNLGHFGLALQQYCHFTSPIRRYADLLVHREIVRILKDEPVIRDREAAKNMTAAAEHISATERKAMQAERDAMDRYRASYMAGKLGEVYRGVITGLNDAGLFVTLPENGVTGFVPLRTLGGDFFLHDRKHRTLTGRRSRERFAPGDPLTIRVEEANGLTGSLIFVPASPAGLTEGARKPRKGRKDKRD